MNTIGVCVLSTVLSCAASEAPAPVDVPALNEVLKQFEQESADIEKDAEAEIRKRSDNIVVELKKVQDAYCKEAKLDEAIAVRDLIRALRGGANAPPPTADLPPAAREVFKQHDEDVAAIRKKAEADIKKRLDKVLVELKKVQDAYCKEAKLDEAVAVRDLIRALRDGRNRALPDPGYLNNPDTDIGKVFFYHVSGIDKDQSVWGSDVYTTGSHLGMAAVHCGLLKAGQKGVVKVTILPGQARYDATTRHGVTSLAYGPWNVSFKVERVYGLAAPR
jgi:hypothetical protein